MIPPLEDDLGRFLERVVLPPGWRVLHERSVISTNDLAREAARRGWPDRSVFVTDYQSAGRGRQGRTWTSPPRTGLLLSVLLRSREARPHAFTMLASVAVAEAVERLLALDPAIKWPNDVVIQDRKVAGVLAEATDDGAERVVVVGIGVNVNVDATRLAELPSATSLMIETGVSVHRGELLVLILERLDAWLAFPAVQLVEALWPAWERRLWRRAQQVTVSDGGEVVEGIVLGGASDGTLRLGTRDGQERRILAGEILP